MGRFIEGFVDWFNRRGNRDLCDSHGRIFGVKHKIEYKNDIFYYDNIEFKSDFIKILGYDYIIGFNINFKKIENYLDKK